MTAVALVGARLAHLGRRDAAPTELSPHPIEAPIRDLELGTTMSTAFDRASLLTALDAIGSAALANGVRLEIAVYGGAALMLASNFRFATEDVDIADIGHPWPIWLTDVVAEIAGRNNWSDDWLNDAVTFHLSPLADRASDHLEFGSFPRGSAAGLTVIVPQPEYMLALKLKAIRMTDPFKGPQEAADIRALMQVVGVDLEDAMDVLRRFFPRTAEDGDKQKFLLKRLMVDQMESGGDAPRYTR